MSRDFVGALLQLNAEKQVPREVLIRALEEGIASAYRRVAGEDGWARRWMPRLAGPTKGAATRRNASGSGWHAMIRGSPNGSTRRG